MPRVNPQSRNVGNVGDILKHAALVELASSLARAGSPVRYVETHTFLLHAAVDALRWTREIDVLAAAHPAYGRYAELERRALAGSGTYRCSAGLVLDALGGRRGTATLAEADPATRAELREQIVAEQISDVVVVDDAAAALRAAAGRPGSDGDRRSRGGRDEAAGAVLVHVDPFTLSPELWHRLAPPLDALCADAPDATVVVYRYTRQAGSPWPPAPAGTCGPIAEVQRNPHEVAVYASAGAADAVRDACAALGWRIARPSAAPEEGYDQGRRSTVAVRSSSPTTIVLAAICSLVTTACAEGSGPEGPGETAADGSGGADAGSVGGGGGGDPVATPGCMPASVDEPCADGWCAETLRVHATNFADVDRTADGSAAIAVGSNGVVYQSCDGAWSRIDLGVATHLSGVYHPTVDFALVVGAGGLAMRWDGEDWSRVETGTTSQLAAAWGTAPDDVWIVGAADSEGTVLLHFDGRSITRSADVAGTAIDLADVRGLAGGPILAVGGTWSSAYSLRHDGTSWSWLPTVEDRDPGAFEEVAILSDGRSFARFGGTATQQLYELVGSSWTERLGTTEESFHALHEDATGALAVVAHDGVLLEQRVLRFDGQDWSVVPETIDFAPSDVWSRVGDPFALAVGQQNAVTTREEDTWQQVAGVAAPDLFPLHVWGTSLDDLTVLTRDRIGRRGADGWTFETHGVGDAVLGTIDAAGTLYAASYDWWENATKVFVRDDAGWRALPKTDVYVGTPEQVAATSPDDVWITGASRAVRFDGEAWSNAPYFCDRMSDGASVSLPDTRTLRLGPDGAVWGAGEGVVRFDGAADTCTTLAAPVGFGDDSVTAIAWTASGELWALTLGGVLWRASGGQLERRTDLAAALPASLAFSWASDLEISASGQALVQLGGTDPDTGVWQSWLVAADLATGAVSSPEPIPSAGRMWIGPAGDVVLATWVGIFRKE